jgi:hypothetical protein
MLCGLLTPTSGTASVNGFSVASEPEACQLLDRGLMVLLEDAGYSVKYSGVFLLQIAPISSEDREALAFRSGSILPSPIRAPQRGG